jgi:hypothetical protein
LTREKFHKKKQHATATAAVGLDALVTVHVYGDDESYFNIEYRCEWCGQETMPVGLPKDVDELQHDLQAMTDKRRNQLSRGRYHQWEMKNYQHTKNAGQR